MYGRAMSCDICDNVFMLPADCDVYLVDASPVGWIRVIVNQPKAYNWPKEERTSPMTEAFDCCSIHCARTVLNRAYDAIPAAEATA